MTQHKQFFDMPGADSLPLKIEISKKQIIFQSSIFRGYVSFRVGNMMILAYTQECFF